jgi:glycosyltransferase involved in cell wall biosynthesis
VDNREISLSVVVPVTNMAGRLRRLESWIEKSHTLIEIIIVHDFRDQETHEELINLSTQYQIRIINGVYGSPGAARNAGIDEASKKWVIFVDSDDFPEITEYIKIIQEAEFRSCCVGIGSYSVKDSETNLELWKSILPMNAKKRDRYLGTDPGIWRYAFKREFIGDLRFPSLSMAEDIVFLSQIHLLNPSIFASPKVVYNYFRNNPSQLTYGKALHKDSLQSLELIFAIEARFSSTPSDVSSLYSTKLFNTVIARGNLKDQFACLRLVFDLKNDHNLIRKFFTTEIMLIGNAISNLLKIVIEKIRIIR